MPHSLCKLWIHAVWSTKERNPFIHLPIEKILYDFMHREFAAMNSPAIIINGMPDHIHCLFSLDPQKSLTDIIKQVKGASSHFINHENIIPEKFSWQRGFAAFSVSPSAVEKVRFYIQNQKEHHRKKSFQEEYDLFMKLYKGINERV